MVAFSESVEVTAFRKWLANNGAYVHPDLRFVKDALGMAIHAAQEIPPNTKVISCPFALAITPGLAKRALTGITKNPDEDLDKLSERELICTYLVMHWILEETQDEIILASSTGFIHLPYLQTLPPADALRTALHFNEDELSLLKGTNLFGVTVDHHAEKDAEWKRCQRFVHSIKTEWASLFTWRKYLTASTYLSSRAFPSTLLSSSPSLISTPSSYPVLLPGLDSLNHSRAHRVSWVISDVETETHFPTTTPPAPGAPLQVSLVIHPLTQANTEVFNNYGPKPNAELILGYGFSLSSNPDDTIVLKIGGQDAAGTRWEVGRNARGAEGLWEELRKIIRDFVDDDAAEWMVDLETAETLQDMTQSKLTKLPQSPAAAPPRVRNDVFVMIQDYVLGQQDILQSLLGFADGRRTRALQGSDQIFDYE